jgi:DNA repair exonuclease SbcCD ATPase subunit
MNIKLKNLTAVNFKGGKFDINFSSVTNISGANAVGKTRIADAFFWLMWGKNSEDAKDFSIKDSVNLTNNKSDHEVFGTFDIDGKEVSLKKVYKEKWTKKRGEPEPEFTGHETVYFFNDVPCSQSEYTSKVSDILPESIAKLITNPFAFNSLKWEQRREALVKIAGNVNDSDIASGSKEFTDLLLMFNDKSLSDLKKEIGAKKKKIRETLDFIPSRIDESERGKPETQDFDVIEKSIEFKQKNIAKIDEASEDLARTHRDASQIVMVKNNELNALKVRLSNLENEASQAQAKELREIKNKISQLEQEQSDCNRNLNDKTQRIANHNSRIANIEKETKELRIKVAAIDAEVAPEMNADETICPSCLQPLHADKIENIKSTFQLNFNKNKLSRKNATALQGKANNEIVKTLQSEISEYEGNLSEYNNRRYAIDKEIEQLHFEYKAKEFLEDKPVSLEVIGLREKIGTFVIPTSPIIDYTEFKERRTQLSNEVSDLKSKLSAKDQITKADQRINELQNNERKLSQEIADLERTEFTIDAFTKAKMDLVETRVNAMFKLVKFRMFEAQINGGTTEACTCLVNGVPFSDANNAGKINAGLDIINTLQSYYNIFAPVWVDNSEAVNEVYPINSQLIKLVVTTGKLTIS